ncbi:MAG: N-acetylmuramoyl-L-alanine amidase [Lachnospiraceae bacterium]|nr:N-acetylmuramoyl-L-alanine amidase [Lachnospiraceae bacterium]
MAIYGKEGNGMITFFQAGKVSKRIRKAQKVNGLKAIAICGAVLLALLSPVSQLDSCVQAAKEGSQASSYETETIHFQSSMNYAQNSKINSGTATLYKVGKKSAKNITVCINAGHGTSGGERYKTLCHPDGTPKVTSGSTAAGAIEATAVSGGTTLLDGTPEAEATLQTSLVIRDTLLKKGYHVLMIRETSDVQLDNIARTLIANEYADCHLAIHYDSTTNDGGAFFCSVPSIASYRNMEPVKSHWEEHNRLGNSIIEGFRSMGLPVRGNGSLEMDLTQTSYSTIPSIDIEVGDRASDHSQATLQRKAEAIAAGLDLFFRQ